MTRERRNRCIQFRFLVGARSQINLNVTSLLSRGSTSGALSRINSPLSLRNSYYNSRSETIRRDEPGERSSFGEYRKGRRQIDKVALRAGLSPSKERANLSDGKYRQELKVFARHYTATLTTQAARTLVLRDPLKSKGKD